MYVATRKKSAPPEDGEGREVIPALRATNR